MASPNPNNLSYFLRNGSILPAYVLGSVKGTADFDYFMRDGVIIFKAAIQAPPATTNKGSTLLSLGIG